MAALFQIFAWLGGGYTLYKFWVKPLPVLWWVTLVLFIADAVYTSAAKEAVARDDADRIKLYVPLLFLVHVALIGIGIYSYTR
jgi:hypothetical protein